MNQDTLKDVFDYNPDTGIFTWKKSQPPRGKAGDAAGYHTHGYIKISYKGKKYYAHRLAWLFMKGYMPSEIDHINQCKSDNRWCNLRESNRGENCANVSGRKGVRARKSGGWQARFSNATLGTFAQKEDAEAARKDAVIKAAGIDPDSEKTAQPQTTTPRKHSNKLYDGKTLAEIARTYGIPQPTLHHRIHVQGLPLEQALKRRMTKS